MVHRNMIALKDLTKAVLRDIQKHNEPIDEVVLRCALTQAKRSGIMTDNIRRALDEKELRGY